MEGKSYLKDNIVNKIGRDGKRIINTWGTSKSSTKDL
jgi:hypothetical protein